MDHLALPLPLLPGNLALVSYLRLTCPGAALLVKLRAVTDDSEQSLGTGWEGLLASFSKFAALL